MNLTDSIRDVLFIYGLAIVVSMGAAVLIRLMVSVLSFGDIWAEWREKRNPKPKTALAAKDSDAENGIPASHVAVIAAAAYAMGASRVVHIQPTTSHAQWSAGGRAAHHSSHQMTHHH